MKIISGPMDPDPCRLHCYECGATLECMEHELELRDEWFWLRCPCCGGLSNYAADQLKYGRNPIRNCGNRHREPAPAPEGEKP